MSGSSLDPIHDVEAAVSKYTPDRDRTFEATDTNAVFVGDGSRWQIVDADNEPWSSSASTLGGSPSVELGPRGFPVINQEYRGRLMNYEAAYTKPVFHWTFDGGTQNIYDSIPLFDKLDLTPTLAISPTHIGTESCMNWDQLREVVTDRGWKLSNHGYEHNRFDETEPADQEREVVQAIEAFRRHGLPHQHYMYSWGMAGGAVGRSIVANVYPFAWGTTDPEDANGIQNIRSPYALPRVFVERSGRQVIEEAVDRALEAETGMVFIGHNIRTDEPVDPDGFETDADLLSHVTEYVRDAGGEWVDSVDEVLRYSRSPIRISGGVEPVQIDRLQTNRAAVQTFSREKVGAVRSISQDTPISTSEWTTLAFDDVVYDDLQQPNADPIELSSGTYAIDLKVGIRTADPVSIRICVADTVISQDQIGSVGSHTINAYPRITEEATVHVEAKAESAATVTAGRQHSRLAIMHLG